MQSVDNLHRNSLLTEYRSKKIVKKSLNKNLNSLQSIQLPIGISEDHRCKGGSKMRNGLTIMQSMKSEQQQQTRKQHTTATKESYNLLSNTYGDTYNNSSSCNLIRGNSQNNKDKDTSTISIGGSSSAIRKRVSTATKTRKALRSIINATSFTASQ